MDGPLDLIPLEACPDCGTALQGGRCRGCGYAEVIPHVERPTDGDELPGVHG